MLKRFVIHIILVFVSTTAYAGNLIFTSGFGGDNDNGAVVQYNLDRKNITTPISLAGNPLAGRNRQQDQYVFSKEDFSTGNGLVAGSDG